MEPISLIYQHGTGEVEEAMANSKEAAITLILIATIAGTVLLAAYAGGSSGLTGYISPYSDGYYYYYYYYTTTSTIPAPPPTSTTTTTSTATNTTTTTSTTPPGTVVANLTSYMAPNGTITQPVNITLPSGGTLTIPPGTMVTLNGTVVTSINITIIPTPPAAPPSQAVAGPIYDFEPSGAVFSKPIQITLPFNPANIPAGYTPKPAYYDQATGQWIPVTVISVDYTNGIIIGETTHFTLYSVVAFQTPPPTVTTTVTTTQTLTSTTTTPVTLTVTQTTPVTQTVTQTTTQTTTQTMTTQVTHTQTQISTTTSTVTKTKTSTAGVILAAVIAFIIGAAAVYLYMIKRK